MDRVDGFCQVLAALGAEGNSYAEVGELVASIVDGSARCVGVLPTEDVLFADERVQTMLRRFVHDAMHVYSDVLLEREQVESS